MLHKTEIARTAVVAVASIFLGAGTVLGQQPVPADTSRITVTNPADTLRVGSDVKQTTEMPLGTQQAAAAPTAGATSEVKPHSIKSFLQQGKFSGHVRSMFMYTDNTDNNPDYNAMAIGTGLSYESGKFHGFQVGVGGFVVFDVFSNDLGPDPETRLGSRYEIGLYNSLDPSDKQDLGRVESLFLRYNYKKSKATLGRQKVNSPFLNPQDGRMQPSLANALWLEVNELEKLSFQGGWVFGISPRSTQEWFSVEESVGTASVGRSVLGGSSQYRDNVSSKGIAIGNVTYKPAKAVQTSLWHYYADNLFNFTFSQTDVNLPVGQNSVVLGMQAGYQQATGDGGNEDQLKAYMPDDAKTWVYSGRVGYKLPFLSTSLNYTHVSEEGRFLFPREWGIETFYTSMPRERLEGSSGSTSVALITDITLSKQWKARVGYGHVKMPDVKDFVMNKYAVPSYSHLQLMTNYAFKGTLDGLVAQLLYVHKGARGNTYDSPNYMVNKVDMSHVTFVMNYNF